MQEPDAHLLFHVHFLQNLRKQKTENRKIRSNNGRSAGPMQERNLPEPETNDI